MTSSEITPELMKQTIEWLEMIPLQGFQSPKHFSQLLVETVGWETSRAHPVGFLEL